MLVVKNLPANVGDIRRCRFDPWLGKIPQRRKATHSRILAWKIPWREEPGGLQPIGFRIVAHD